MKKKIEKMCFSNFPYLHVVRHYGEFLYLRPALPYLNIRKPAIVFLDSVDHQEIVCEEKTWKNASFKYHLLTHCPSQWRISILAIRIAIPEYYKTRNCFLDSGGHQEAGREEKIEKNVFFQTLPWHSSFVLANFHSCDCHAWILQNPQLY